MEYSFSVGRWSEHCRSAAEAVHKAFAAAREISAAGDTELVQANQHAMPLRSLRPSEIVLGERLAAFAVYKGKMTQDVDARMRFAGVEA